MQIRDQRHFLHSYMMCEDPKGQHDDNGNPNNGALRDSRFMQPLGHRSAGGARGVGDSRQPLVKRSADGARDGADIGHLSRSGDGERSVGDKGNIVSCVAAHFTSDESTEVDGA
jgi:hypothetical protein